MNFKKRHSVLIASVMVTQLRQNCQKRTSIKCRIIWRLVMASSSYDHVGLIKHYESLLVSAMVARFRKYKLSIWKKLRNLKDSDETIIVNSANIYLLKVNNRNTRTRCEICSNLTIKTLERRVSIVNFRHVIVGWESYMTYRKRN